MAKIRQSWLWELSWDEGWVTYIFSSLRKRAYLTTELIESEIIKIILKTYWHFIFYMYNDLLVKLQFSLNLWRAKFKCSLKVLES